jgi:hypothetical protein
MKLNKIIGFFIVLSVLVSCRKKTNNGNPIPNISFDITINTNLPSYSDLNGVGGWAYVNGVGVNGVIVYRKELNSFVAFDRRSPKDVNGDCPQPLVPDTDNFLQLIDSCNNAVFSLYDGSPVSNSEYGLRQYQTIWDGSNQLRIFN